MKICHIIANPTVGGAEKYALYLSEETKKSGNEVSFVLGSKGPLYDQCQTRSTNTQGKLSNVTCLPARQECQIVPMRSSFNPFLVMGSSLKLKKIFTEKKIDIVHTHFLREQSLVIGSKIFGSKIKLVRTFHRLDQFNLKMKPILWLYRKKTDSFIAVSDITAKYMVENGIKKEKITTIYNGAPEIKTEKHEKAMGYLGRVVAEKGILDFVKENDGILKENRLVIAGEGEDLSEIKKLRDTKNLNIEILGRVDDLSEFFSKISLLILPTKGESTFPLSVTEAFSAGVPVLSFDVEPISTIVKESRSGELVGLGNFKKMGQEAGRLLNNEAEIDKMSALARKLYQKKFTVSAMWRKTESLYKKLLSDKNSVSRIQD